MRPGRSPETNLTVATLVSLRLFDTEVELSALFTVLADAIVTVSAMMRCTSDTGENFTALAMRTTFALNYAE